MEKERDIKNKVLLIILSILLILGIILSLYMIYIHYSNDGSSLCDIGKSMDCNIVNKGPYSTLGGPINLLFGAYLDIPIPNALLGMIIFLLILSGVSVIYHNAETRLHTNIHRKIYLKKIENYKILRYIRILLWISIIYSFYLVYIEAFVLFTWCIFCIAMDLIIIAALILAYSIKADSTVITEDAPSAENDSGDNR